jgi:3-keto-5-aminohexanoate cleavage enzyme
MKELKNYLLRDYRDMMTRVDAALRYGANKMPPVIITCAVTGGNQGAESCPGLPETLEDQVQSCYDAYNAGASMVHIHRRDPNNLGDVSNRWEDYYEVNHHIREKCPDLIINNTIIGCHNVDLETGNIGKPLDVAIPAKPEVGSVDIYATSGILPLKPRQAPLQPREKDYREYNFYMPAKTCTEIVNRMKANDILPEWEIFDMGNLKLLNRMIAEGVAEAPHWMQLAFGGSGIPPAPEKMIDATMTLPGDSLVSILSTGACQTMMVTMAMLLGHHVRVGLEDNIYYSAGQLAESNAQMVERVVRIAKEIGREVATPEQARAMMGLGAPRQYPL